MNITAEERFWRKVRKDPNGCWEWQGAKGQGYGNFYLHGKFPRAHRYAYELLVGPIPDGLTLDHLCRNRACVNPDHLEPVTQKVNTLRGEGLAAQNARKTHCPEGHPLNGDNLYQQPGNGYRRCRECGKIKDRLRNRKKMKPGMDLALSSLPSPRTSVSWMAVWDRQECSS